MEGSYTMLKKNGKIVKSLSDEYLYTGTLMPKA